MDIDLASMKSLPFQTQITFKSLDGNKCIRVITEQMAISNDRDEVEERADFKILGQNAVHKTAFIGSKGDYRESQAYAKNWKRKMNKRANSPSKVAVTMCSMQHMKNFYEDVGVQEQLEQVAEENVDEQEEKKVPEEKTGFFNRVSGFFGSKKKDNKKRDSDSCEEEQ